MYYFILESERSSLQYVIEHFLETAQKASYLSKSERVLTPSDKDHLVFPFFKAKNNLISGIYNLLSKKILQKI